MPENTAGVAGQSGVGGAGQSGAAAAAGPSGEATGEDDVAGPSTAKRQRVITDPALALQRVEGLVTDEESDGSIEDSASEGDLGEDDCHRKRAMALMDRRPRMRRLQYALAGTLLHPLPFSRSTLPGSLG